MNPSGDDSIRSHESDMVRAKSLLEDGPVLLFDGECGVCAASVQWLLRRESSSLARVVGRPVRFAPLQSSIGTALRETTSVPRSVDSVIWVEKDEKGRIEAEYYSSAVFRALAYLGGLYRVLLVLALLPRAFRDFFYRLFARYRLRLVSPVCLVPTRQERARFLETFSH